MAANTIPIFPLTPVISGCTISTANTNRDGSGDLGNVITGATDGTRIDRITVKARVTTTAGAVRLFVCTGEIYYFLDEVIVTAITVGASTASFAQTLYYDRGLILPYNYLIKASTHNAETFDVTAFGGNY